MQRRRKVAIAVLSFTARASAETGKRRHVEEESGATPSKVKVKVEATKKVLGSREKSLRTPPEPRQETPSNAATEKKTAQGARIQIRHSGHSFCTVRLA